MIMRRWNNYSHSLFILIFIYSNLSPFTYPSLTWLFQYVLIANFIQHYSWLHRNYKWHLEQQLQFRWDRRLATEQEEGKGWNLKQKEKGMSVHVQVLQFLPTVLLVKTSGEQKRKLVVSYCLLMMPERRSEATKGWIMRFFDSTCQLRSVSTGGNISILSLQYSNTTPPPVWFLWNLKRVIWWRKL